MDLIRRQTVSKMGSFVVPWGRLPKVLWGQEEWQFIFRAHGRTRNYCKGAGEQAKTIWGFREQDAMLELTAHKRREITA